MGAFFSSDSQPVVYYSIWEMHGFPHKFPTVWENATKSMVWGKSGKLVLIIFHSMGAFFPSDFQPMVYYSIWEMHEFSHKFYSIWEIHGFSHKFPAVWENITKPIVWGKPGKLILIPFL